MDLRDPDPGSVGQLPQRLTSFEWNPWRLSVVSSAGAWRSRSPVVRFTNQNEILQALGEEEAREAPLWSSEPPAIGDD